MNVLFEDDGQLKAGTVLADHDASLQVEAASGKRLKIKAGNVLLALSPRPSPGETLRHGGEARGASSIRRSCGRCPAKTNSASTTWRASTTARSRRRRSRPRSRCCCTRRRCTSTRAARAATARRPPDALKAALAIGRAQAARGRADRRMGRRSFARARAAATRLRPKLAMLLYRPDKNALEWKALARGVRRAQDESGRAARRLRRDSVDARLSLQRFLVEAFPQGVAFPDWGALPPLPELPRRRRARILDRRRNDDRDRRRVLGARACQRQLRDRHPHRGAGARDAARQRRSIAIARARLSTVYMPGRKLTMLPDEAVAAFTLQRRRRPAGAVALRRDDARRRAGPARDARRSRAGRREPAARRGRRSVRQRPAVAVRSAVDAQSCACCGSSRSTCRQRAARTTSTRIDYSFYVDWDADRASASRDGSRSCRARAASPLDKLIAELMIHVNSTWGRAARRARRGRALSHAVDGQGQDEHAARASTRASASRTTCGRARRCAATATSSTSGSCSP